MPNNKINKCFHCASDFTIFNRKHHCRICGRIFVMNVVNGVER